MSPFEDNQSMSVSNIADTDPTIELPPLAIPNVKVVDSSSRTRSKRKYNRSTKPAIVPKSAKKRSKLERAKKKANNNDIITIHPKPCSRTTATTRAVRALKEAMMKEGSEQNDGMKKEYPWLNRITPEQKERNDLRDKTLLLESRRKKRHAQFCVGAHVYSNHESVVENLPNVPIVKGHCRRRENVNGRIVKQGCMDPFVWLVMFDNGKNIFLHEKYMTFKSRVAPSHLLGADDDNFLTVIEAQKEEDKEKDKIIHKILNSTTPVTGNFRKALRFDEVEDYFKPKHPWLTSDMLRKYAVLHEGDLSNNKNT